MENYENKMAVIVSKYATPLAVLLIGMGILFALPSGSVRSASIALLIFGIVFNRVMLHMIEEEGAGRGLVMTRLFVNVFLNTVIACLMTEHWPAIWLLLALTPIAAAIYSSRQDTLAAAGIVSGVILAIHFMRGAASAGSWGGEAAHCLFVLFISLLINELAQLARSSREQS